MRPLRLNRTMSIVLVNEAARYGGRRIGAVKASSSMTGMANPTRNGAVLRKGRAAWVCRLIAGRAAGRGGLAAGKLMP